jgi:two-component system phosphate regulon sensor histidine kinase PhoR
MPAIFFSAYEISTLGEYEQLIADVYQQQLETNLCSANQYAWDYVNSWMEKVQRVLLTADSKSAAQDMRRLIQTNPAIKYVLLLDTLLNPIYSFANTSDGEALDINSEKELLISQKQKIAKLQNLSNQGYRKVESVMKKDTTNSAPESMTLFYIQPLPKKQSALVAIILNPQLFITDILGPKLREIAGSQFVVVVFNEKNNQFIFSNIGIAESDVNLKKKLWLFPDYVLGIGLEGRSVEDLARGRFFNSVILIGILNILLIVGGWFLIRNIRKEMQLAQLKSDFVSNVSHELRTPLALIRMYAETLEMGRTKSAEKREEYYRIINQESQRLTRLINNILNFSRIDSGRKEYRFIKVDINRVIEEVLEMYTYHIEQEGFKLDVNLKSPLPEIKADREAFSESVINLIDNAIKYSGKIKEISISTDTTNDHVLFEIKDRGIGIDTKHQQAIFDKFYRVSSGLVHNTKGSGLGLSLVKHIVDSHGGYITLNSESGNGSTFRLFFPIYNKNE